MSHLNRYICFAMLIFCTFVAEAVQLGAAKGSAVFGRPLDLSVQVKLDVPAEELANCFSADVFQADNKFDAGRVRLDVLPAANGLDATLRIRSATAVNEPWAKVILRSHCGAKISRQYDFLTDFAADAPSSNMLAEATPVQPLTSAAPVITTSSLGTLAPAKAAKSAVQVKDKAKTTLALKSKSSTQIAMTSSQTSKQSSSQKIKPVTSSSPETSKASQLSADATGQARLKLETFELTDEHQVLLKLSTALVAPTGMRTPEEIQALAQATAVWRAINGMPAEVSAPAATVAAETTVKTPAIDAPTATIPSLVNQKLAGKSEFSNLMVYGLIGLLAMTLGCIAWLWLRVRKVSRAGYDWLNPSDADENLAEHEPTQFLFSNFHETETTAPEPQDPILENEAEIVIDETEDNNHEISSTMPSTLPISSQSESALSASPLASLLSDSKQGDSHQKSALKPSWKAEKITVSTASETPIAPPPPPHFDDPRFDERILRTKKKSKESSHTKPIASSAELMDLVIADSPHKLRSVTSTPPVMLSPTLEAESDELPAVSASTKKDFKNNLIDFEIFAEPEPLNKPTRFVR